MAAYTKDQLLDHIRSILSVYQANPNGGSDGNRPYRIKTFRTLIDLLTPLSEEEIQQVADGTLKIRNIGDSSRQVIKQFLNTGTTDRYQQIKDEIPSDINQESNGGVESSPKQQVMDILCGIHGVGHVTAEKWIDLGIKTLEDVNTAVNLGLISLTHQQQIGYTYYHHLSQRIPRAEMDLLAGKVSQLLSGATFEICGSYRRGAPNSGDIDVLVQNNGQYDFSQVINAIQSDEKFIVAVLTPDAKKVYMAVCQLGPEYLVRRIDVKMVPQWAWGSALLHYTGPDNLNKAMRDVAISKHLRLSEYGLYSYGQVQSQYSMGNSAFLIGVLSPNKKHVHMAIPIPATRGISFISDGILVYDSDEQLIEDLRQLIIRKKWATSDIIYEQFYDTPNEEHVFQVLGLDYLTPVQRQSYAS